MDKAKRKKIGKYISNGLFGLILLILIVPSWRVSFQGWFQGLFLHDIALERSFEKPLPFAVNAWELETMATEKKELSDFYDKPILLSFWATWCPPCRAELKSLKALAKNLNDKVHFIACSEERIETIKKSGLDQDYSFLYRTNHTPSFFEMTAYPTLCIIDKNQRLIFKHEGAGGLDSEKNIKFLNRLVENR